MYPRNTGKYCNILHSGQILSLNFDSGKKLDLKVNLGMKATSVRPEAKSLTYI